MEPATRIGTVRVRSLERDSPALRLAVAARLGGADARPSGLPPAAILVVRSLADPLPGRLGARRGGFRPDPLWERALRERLTGLSRGAARPRRGWIPPGAEAVVFADEAELLACLALDLARGTARHHWWWRTVLGRFPSNSLTPVLIERAQVAPAAFACLARWGEAAPVVRALGDSELARVGEAIARAHGLSAGVLAVLAVPAVLPEEATASSMVRQLQAGASPTLATPPAPAPWRRWLPEAQAAGLTPERECLIGVALALHAAPARVRSRRFAMEARRWWQGARAAATDPGLAPHRTGPPSGGGSGGDRAAAPSPAKRGRVGEGAVQAQEPPPQPSPTLTRGRGRHRPTHPSQGGGTHPPDQPGASSNSSGEEALPSLSGADAFAPDYAPEAELALPLLPLAGSPQPTSFPEEGFLTRLGGVLYLVNLIEHLDLLGRFEHEGEADLCGPWGFLELLARALLGPLTEEHEHDPLWPALAELDGRDPTDRLDPALSPWLTALLPDLRLRLGEALGIDSGEAAATLLLCPGRVYVTSSHVDLVADLDAISLPVRRAGLDRDPGWLPRFGRVVLFHFE